MIYGLYRKTSAEFMLENLGETSISDNTVPLSVRETLLAINKYSAVNNFLIDEQVKPLQKLMLLASWYLSDKYTQPLYMDQNDLSKSIGISFSIREYLTGKTSNFISKDTIDSLEDFVSDLGKSIRKGQDILLTKLFKDFYADNRRAYPGVHGVYLEYTSLLSSVKLDYSPDWSNPNVMAKHYVELLLRQGGLLPAGKHGEGAQDYDVQKTKDRHHINFYKPSNDVMNLIMLGDLHFKYAYLEGTKNLDYYSRMRTLRNNFEDGIPPSFWESDLQDLYIERLIEFVNEWESNGVIEYTYKGPNRYILVNGKWVVDTSKIDFLKMNHQGTTYNLQEMIKKGWITTDFVDNIIADLRQKLESRGLM
jgi:hypothetical protein